VSATPCSCWCCEEADAAVADDCLGETVCVECARRLKIAGQLLEIHADAHPGPEHETAR
jgi:hypothetical protein